MLCSEPIHDSRQLRLASFKLARRVYPDVSDALTIRKWFPHTHTLNSSAVSSHIHSLAPPTGFLNSQRCDFVIFVFLNNKPVFFFFKNKQKQTRTRYILRVAEVTV